MLGTDVKGLFYVYISFGLYKGLYNACLKLDELFTNVAAHVLDKANWVD